MSEVQGWFAGRLPEEWFEGFDVTVDREEIVVVGTLPAPADEGHVGSDDEVGDDGDNDENGAERRGTEAGRIARFREDTRDARIRIAREAERRFGRKVAWGVRCGETEQLFTHLAVPVMTRLRQPERRVLDTLVEAGVARSRSEALAWSVRLVGQHESDWIDQLREALVAVQEARKAGPGS